MFYSRNIVKEIAEITLLKDLTEVYGEIASIRMRRIRDYVLKNRDFLSSIESIFKDALDYYLKKISDMVKGGKIKDRSKLTFLAHNGRTVAVLISANTGFYGNVVRDTFRKFIQDIEKENVEVTIIGRLGRTLFIEEKPKHPYTYFDLPDYGIDESKLNEAIRHLVQYEEIRVYYGKYYSVITQKPEMFIISAGHVVSDKVDKEVTEYIFEPSVENILMFFETQIFASLFDQAVRESQLAKFASRILSMDKANSNISNRLNSLNIEKLKIIHNSQNKKLINSLAPLVFRN